MTLEQLVNKAFEQYQKVQDKLWPNDIADAYVNSLEKQHAPKEHIEYFLCSYNAKLRALNIWLMSYLSIRLAKSLKDLQLAMIVQMIPILS